MTTVLLLLFLLANGAALALPREPPKCRQGPEFWCRDAATATRCGQLQFCLEHSWDELPEDVDERHPLVRCWICNMVITTLKSMVPKNHNDTSVAKAVKKVCSTIGFLWASACHRVVDRYVHPIEEGLNQDLEPREICAKIGMCSRESHPAWRVPGHFRSPEDAVGP